MLHPRKTNLNGKESLVADEQMVGYREHLTQNHRMLFFTGEIGVRCSQCGMGETESHNLLLALDSISNDPIKIVITSQGGHIDSALLFIDTIKMISAPVITIGRYSASAACLVLASGSKRYLFPHAKTMLHLPSGIMGGDAREWDIQHQQMITYKNKIIDVLTEAGVKKSREEILIDIDRDFWLEPAEAITYGLADEVLTPELWRALL